MNSGVWRHAQIHTHVCLYVYVCVHMQKYDMQVRNTKLFLTLLLAPPRHIQSQPYKCMAFPLPHLSCYRLWLCLPQQKENGNYQSSSRVL